VVTNTSEERIATILRVEVSQNGDVTRVYRIRMVNGNVEKKKKAEGD
jgi:hypothetical protein